MDTIQHNLVRLNMDIINGKIEGDRAYTAQILNSMGVILADAYLNEYERSENYKQAWIDKSKTLAECERIELKLATLLPEEHKENQRLQTELEASYDSDARANLRVAELQSIIEKQREALSSIINTIGNGDGPRDEIGRIENIAEEALALTPTDKEGEQQ